MTSEELVKLAHEARDIPYPDTIELEVVSEALHSILSLLLEGRTPQATTGLSRLIDSLENGGKKAKRRLH